MNDTDSDFDPNDRYSYVEVLDDVLNVVMEDQLIHDRAVGHGVSPIDALIRDLAVARLDAVRMRDHSCVWSGEGYCNLCGRERIGS